MVPSTFQYAWHWAVHTAVSGPRCVQALPRFEASKVFLLSQNIASAGISGWDKCKELEFAGRFCQPTEMTLKVNQSISAEGAAPLLIEFSAKANS